jgi:MscS family membrane protein
VPLPQFTKLARYLSFLLIGWFIRIIVPALQLNIETSSFVQKAISIFMIVIVTLIILLLITIGLERAKTLALKTDSRMDDQLIPLLNRIIKIIVVIIAVIAILRLMNVNVTALIAGISIGGLALALAAQDTVKNLIGSVMIFIDQPFQMGDNGSIANMSVKNLGVRVFRIFNITLGITYDSTPEQIQDFIGRLKQMILSNEMISHETYYVHFKELADSSLNIMFRCYLKTATYAEELQLKEELLLEILRIARDCGVSFAFPSTSIYMENNQEDSAIQPNLKS